MASKTHCDVCDLVPATDKAVKSISIPGKPHWDRSRLTLSIYVTDHEPGDGEPYNRKDICVDCLRKLVADAFALRTPDEYNALLDKCNKLEGQTITIGEPA